MQLALSTAIQVRSSTVGTGCCFKPLATAMEAALAATGGSLSASARTTHSSRYLDVRAAQASSAAILTAGVACVRSGSSSSSGVFSFGASRACHRGGQAEASPTAAPTAQASAVARRAAGASSALAGKRATSLARMPAASLAWAAS